MKRRQLLKLFAESAVVVVTSAAAEVSVAHVPSKQFSWHLRGAAAAAAAPAAAAAAAAAAAVGHFGATMENMM